MIRRRRPDSPPEAVAALPRDEGIALIFALIFVILGSMIILPLLSYAQSVMKGNKVQHDKADRAAAVTGSMRLALADPSKLFVACSASGLHNEIDLATVSDLGVRVLTECTTVGEASELSAADLRIAMTTVAVGSNAPQGTVGDVYANSGVANTATWLSDYTTTSKGGKIFLPYLPTHALNHPASSGYMMPSWAGNCRVFFPGTYIDPVTISDNTPTFFTSGVYYFENSITFGANANVVIGEGAIEACTTNAEAAFYAINAPAAVSISGIGGTFVFGGAGRLVFTDGGAAAGPSVLFNARLVDPTDVGNSVTQGVSIVSVNGVQLGATSSSDTQVVNYLQVPKSLTETNPTDAVAPVDAASTSYHPSTLVPQPAPAAEVTPIIQVSLTGTGSATLYIPGYVSVPQGRVQINTTAAAADNKSVQLVGGVLAAKFTETADLPSDLQMGFVNRIVQKTFKIFSQTDPAAGVPHVISTAIVQVNDYGEYSINSWVVTNG
ncbi:MAG: hypothetical protein WCK21_00895 [Actinomycetota bacterium]